MSEFEFLDGDVAAVHRLSEEIEIYLDRWNLEVGGVQAAVHPWAIGRRDDTGRLIAGISGRDAFRWRHIRHLWVAPSHQRGGIGRALVGAVEDDAIRRGRDGIEVDTLSFQAPEFYRALGYLEAGRVPDKPRGFERIYFYKTLPRR